MNSLKAVVQESDCSSPENPGVTHFRQLIVSSLSLSLVYVEANCSCDAQHIVQDVTFVNWIQTPFTYTCQGLSSMHFIARGFQVYKAHSGH